MSHNTVSHVRRRHSVLRQLPTRGLGFSAKDRCLSNCTDDVKCCMSHLQGVLGWIVVQVRLTWTTQSKSVPCLIFKAFWVGSWSKSGSPGPHSPSLSVVSHDLRHHLDSELSMKQHVSKVPPVLSSPYLSMCWQRSGDSFGSCACHI